MNGLLENGLLRLATLVVPEKYSRLRRVPLAPVVRAAVAEWLACVPANAVFLFPHPFSPQQPCLSTARTALRRLCKRAGVQPPCSPHDLRHHLVAACMAQGSRLEDVARFLGHSSASTTFRHYWSSKPTTDDIRAAPAGEGEEDAAIRWALHAEAEAIVALEARLAAVAGEH